MIYSVLLKQKSRTANLFTMKTAILSLAFIAVSLLTLNSCGIGDATKEAEKTAETFHQYMNSHDYSSMIGMIHSEGLAMTPKEDWLQLFKSMESLGKIKRIKQNMSFNTSIKNGITTVELSYTIKYADKTMTEKLLLRKDSDTFKLMGYSIKELED